MSTSTRSYLALLSTNPNVSLDNANLYFGRRPKMQTASKTTRRNRFRVNSEKSAHVEVKIVEEFKPKTAAFASTASKSLNHNFRNINKQRAQLKPIPLDIGQIKQLTSSLYNNIVDKAMFAKISLSDMKAQKVNRFMSVVRDKTQNMIDDLNHGDNTANRVRRKMQRIDQITKINERHMLGLDKWGDVLEK